MESPCRLLVRGFLYARERCFDEHLVRGGDLFPVAY